MLKHVCNVCGNDFDQWDEQEGYAMNYHCGYGSQFDGNNIQLDLCCGCFDELLKEYILPKCKINPMSE